MFQAYTSRGVWRIAEEATEAGSHWFDPSTLRFFRSRPARKAYSADGVNWLFISSETPPHGTRRYTVRRYVAPRDFDNVGEFMEHETRSAAWAALLRELRLQARTPASGAEVKR